MEQGIFNFLINHKDAHAYFHRGQNPKSCYTTAWYEYSSLKGDRDAPLKYQLLALNDTSVCR